MTAQSAAIAPTHQEPEPGRHVPRLSGTVLRKELTEWLRGPEVPHRRRRSRSLGAVFMTLIPFIARRIRARPRPPSLTSDNGSDHQRPARLDRSDRRPDRRRRHDGARLGRA